MIELISGVTYLSSLLDDIEVDKAVSEGKVPQVPMVTARHKSHQCEDKVQNYLRQHGIRSRLTYQSMFVGWGPGTAVEKKIVSQYGIPLVVRPELMQELVVASLGDLQNVVCSMTNTDAAAIALDERIVNLAGVPDRTAVIRGLVKRAEAHNKSHHGNPLYVEARIYRRWVHEDFIRPCMPSDYRTRLTKA